MKIEHDCDAYLVAVKPFLSGEKTYEEALESLYYFKEGLLRDIDRGSMDDLNRNAFMDDIKNYDIAESIIKEKSDMKYMYLVESWGFDERYSVELYSELDSAESRKLFIEAKIKQLKEDVKKRNRTREARREIAKQIEEETGLDIYFDQEVIIKKIMVK